MRQRVICDCDGGPIETINNKPRETTMVPIIAVIHFDKICL